jgi:hypothetical protein
MRWNVTTSKLSKEALDFCKVWLSKFDYDSLETVNVKRGKSGYGVYGWCDYVAENSRPYTLSLFIPGPFPYTVTTKEPSVKLKLYDLNRTIPDSQTVASRNISQYDETVTVKLETRTTLNDFSEGLVFLFGHELHHYLASDDKVTAEDTEKNADEYCRLLLSRFRQV